MISKHFSESEWECQNCSCKQMYVHQALVNMTEDFRAYLCKKYKKEVRINVHCVNRCKKKNNRYIKYGASKRSLHLKGKAMDLHSDDLTIHELIESAKECHTKKGILNGGLGIYRSWNNPGIHFDIGRYRSW